MSEEKKPKKKKPSEDDISEHSDEELRPDMSPDAAEDSCLLSVHPTKGAEALPIGSENGASGTSTGLTSLFRKISPFKNKDSSKAAKPPCKKLKKESSFVKAKNAFSRTFRRSEPTIQSTDLEMEEMRRRKLSDPTHSKTKIKAEPVTETESEKKSASFFGVFSGTRSKKTKSKTKEAKKEPKNAKTKKKPKGIKERRLSTFEDPSTSTSKTVASPGIQKKALSPRSSYQPSIGAVSVGFFNEGLLPSESSGNPTESTSLDIKSGSSFSPDAFSGSRRHTISKRQQSFKESDEESSSD